MNYPYCKLAEKYIADVTGNKITVGQNARLAVERHLSDLTVAKEKGWKFSKLKAEIALTFIANMRHTKAEWAKKTFNLTPYQAFIGYCIFGWLLENGYRRFTKSYIRTPRKWGKSEFAAAIGCYMLLADGEAGSEVYAGATTFSQARKVFDPAAAMMRMARNDDPDIRKGTKVFSSRNNCVILFDDGEIVNKFVPLSQDSDTSEEGSSPHCGIVDEYHLHPNTKTIDMLETGTGARKQALIFIITTPGFDLAAPCYAYDKVACKILRNEITVDRTFVMIFDMDEGDAWDDPANWPKANPQIEYGITTLDHLKDGLQKARAEGFSKERAFRVKNLGQWLSSQSGWIPEEFFQKAITPFTFEDMRGQTAFGGFDFASIRDLNSCCFLFPPSEDYPKFRLKWRIYCPAATIDDPKRNEGKAAYRRWEREGWLIRTDGNAADFDAIVADILDTTADLDIHTMGYDRRFALTPVTKLADEGLKMEPVSQMFTGHTVPMMQAEILFLNGLLEIEPNPVAEWMFSNAVVVQGEGDMTRISKDKSVDKVDGVVAMLDAFWVYLASFGDPGDFSAWAHLSSNMVQR